MRAQKSCLMLFDLLTRTSGALSSNRPCAKVKGKQPKSHANTLSTALRIALLSFGLVCRTHTLAAALSAV
eukprot:768475-Hanusia_phi.AAC.10